MIDTLFAIRANRAVTLALITHDEQLAARCDRILRMTDGRVSAEEPAKEAMQLSQTPDAAQ